MVMRDDQEQVRTFTRRTALLMGGQVILLSGVAARMYQLQVSESDRFATLAEENRINTRLLLAPRGRIFDRAGKPVAINEEDYRAVIVPERTKDIEGALDRLSEIIRVEPEIRDKVLAMVRRRRRSLPVTVATGLTWEEVTRIEVNAPDLPGVLTERGLMRIYPKGELLSLLVGYVGPVSEKEQDSDPDPLLKIPEFRIGKQGIERHYDLDLRGASGTQRVEINASGRVQRELSRQEGKAGKDLYMTVDSALQDRVMKAIAPHRAAAAVVMDIHNGDIVAMASTPTYDPNLFARGISPRTWRALTRNRLGPMNNKAASGAYAPGSTFKMLVALAGLENGLIDHKWSATCRGVFGLGKARYHCWRRGGHGVVSLRQAIKSSCDVYFYNLALKVGVDRIAAMANRLGLGVDVGFDMPNAKRGLMPTKEWKKRTFKGRNRTWYPGETVIAAIGQGYVLATPLQLAVMTARIANGGFAVTPRVVRPDGKPDPKKKTPPASKNFKDLGLKKQNLALITDAMNAVTNEQGGTAYWTRIQEKEMAMAGKTGTSQVRRITKAERARGVIRNDQLPWKRRDHALFVGFAPVDDPRFAVSVVVEHGGSGSKAAAPIAKDILTEVQKRYPRAKPLEPTDQTQPPKAAKK